MTRINCIAISDLSDQHLLAEYKEITRPFNKVLKRIEKYGVDNALNNVEIPNSYVLGKGHESFFFDKLLWLYMRYKNLYVELTKRDFNMNMKTFEEICSSIRSSLSHTPYFNNWEPNWEDKYLNMSRLCKRSGIESVKSELAKLT